MKSSFRQSMAWLHTWAGLLVGWVLFSIFLMGSASYYRAAITDWMQPERFLTDCRPISADCMPPRTVISGLASTIQASEDALHYLQRRAPGAKSWIINLPNNSAAAIRVTWQAADFSYHSASLPAPAATRPRDTQGGDFFYTFHYQLYYVPSGIGSWIVGFCAMAMLVALISGIVTHRRIFIDFFTFRPGKGQRSWLDAHNVSAVLALPYYLTITYTGLVMLVLTLVPWGISARYPPPASIGDFFSEAYDFQFGGQASGKPTPLTPIAPLLKSAANTLHRSPGEVWIDNPGDAAATVKISATTDERLSIASESVTFSGRDGKQIAAHTANTAAATTTGVMYGIHEAYFAPSPVRILFFLSGLAGALMVASGLILWAKKHRQKDLKHGRIGMGTHLVEHLNIATIAGLPIAMAAYFWANRLLPVAMPQHADWETRIFFIVWSCAAVHPLLRPQRRAWIEQFTLGTLSFALLPLVDFITIGRWVIPAFDVTLLALAALLGVVTLFIVTRRPAQAVPAHIKYATKQASELTAKNRKSSPETKTVPQTILRDRTGDR